MTTMKTPPVMADGQLTSWAVEQALGVMAVDNIRVSAFTRNLLNRCVRGEITVEQAREAIRQKAQGQGS